MYRDILFFKRPPPPHPTRPHPTPPRPSFPTLPHSHSDPESVEGGWSRFESPHSHLKWMEGSLFHHSHFNVCRSPLTFPLFVHPFFLSTHTNTTVNFKLFLVHHKRGFWFFSLHGCQQQQIPVLKRCSVQVCCHKGFFVIFLFQVVCSFSHFFPTFPRSQPPFPREHRCCPEFFHNLADAVSSVLVL